MNTFLTNLKNRIFIAESKSYGQMNFQNGRYGIYIARENGHFAYDLGIRRNHFCWVRDAKLLLDFKFHNFSNQYVSVAKENVFWSIIVKLDRPEMGLFANCLRIRRN